MTTDTRTAEPTIGVRPRWSALGGGALLAGALALFAATIVEFFVWQTTTTATGVFVVFSILFFANVVLYLVAMPTLAFAGGGIAGSSRLGRAGLVLFGVGWAVQQVIYWVGYFVSALPPALEVLGVVALVVTYLGAITAAVVIALGRVVRGLARWALLIGFVVAGICAAIGQGVADATATTSLLCLSCLAQAVVGVVYLRARVASGS